MYFYASHLGNGIYGSEEEIDEEYLYCETCGDADFCIGVANNREELKNLLKEHDFYCNNYILLFQSSNMSSFSSSGMGGRSGSVRQVLPEGFSTASTVSQISWKYSFRLL